jgi:SAM-dependent methyltransferase
MVAHTASLLGDRAQVFQRDARDPGLPERSYDVVVSSLVLFFLPDPAAALERWVRLVAPGGRIALATFGKGSPAWERLDQLLVPAMPQLDPKNLGPDNPFASDEGMERLLAGAGAEGIRTTVRRIPVDFADVEAWHAWSRTVGQRVAWERMDGEATRAVLDAAEPVIAGGAEFWSDARYTVGTVPG